MATERYQLADVLAVAKIHPFYNPDVDYPPDADTVRRLRGLIDQKAKPALQEQPLLNKKTL
jgi:hypothetical protein